MQGGCYWGSWLLPVNLRPHAAGAWGLLPKIFVKLLPLNLNEKKNVIWIAFSSEWPHHTTASPGRGEQAASSSNSAAPITPGHEPPSSNAGVREKLIATTVSEDCAVNQDRGSEEQGRSLSVCSDLRWVLLSQDCSWAILEQRKCPLVIPFLSKWHYCFSRQLGFWQVHFFQAKTVLLENPQAAIAMTAHTSFPTMGIFCTMP